ncbi:MAG: type III-B CRISPR module-associated Cmr3 family protein [Lentisphaeria bacterium]
MKTHQLQLLPQDVLFLRDARPMEAADAGCGANWPRPDQLWNALIHQFHRLWPERQSWEGEAHHKKAAELNSTRHSSDRFGALQTAGPFPLADGVPYFPCPLDLAVAEDCTLLPMHLVPARGTDLPQLLTYAFSTPVLGKQLPPVWISREEYLCYLQGKPFRPAKKTLYDMERNIGIAIDTDTGTAREGQIYQAEYLRLREQVGLAFLASCEIKPKGGGNHLVDVLAKIPLPSPLIIGGQQGLADIAPSDWSLPAIQAPAATEKNTRLLRWTLLSPAVFPKIAPNPPANPSGHAGGCLPAWIHPDTFEVQLPMPTADSQRLPGEDRESWRKRRLSQGRIQAKLVAARIGKPLCFSGWDLHQKTANGETETTQGAKPTQAAVPSGSVYVFECKNSVAFQSLWLALDAQGSDGRIVRRSTNSGEKGFGIGVCSVFPNEQP